MSVSGEVYNKLLREGAVAEASGIRGFSEYIDSKTHIIDPKCLTFMNLTSLDAIFEKSVVMIGKENIQDFTDYYEVRKRQKSNCMQQD